MANAVFTCHNCGGRVEVLSGRKVSRLEECSACGADLHACRNCRYFDPGRNNQCSEPQAEWVSDKEKANFCDFFEPRTKIDLVGRKADGGDTRKKFDDLFK